MTSSVKTSSSVQSFSSLVASKSASNTNSGFNFKLMSASRSENAISSLGGSVNQFSWPPNLTKSPDEPPTQEDEKDLSFDPQSEVSIEEKADLPSPVVVETGEEDETTLFSERAKLFRWDSVGD